MLAKLVQDKKKADAEADSQRKLNQETAREKPGVSEWGTIELVDNGAEEFKE